MRETCEQRHAGEGRRDRDREQQGGAEPAVLADDRMDVEGDVRLQQLKREREQHDRREQHPELSVSEGRPQRGAEADLRRDARQLGPVPHARDRHVLADERECRDRDRHRPEPDPVHERGAGHQADRRSGDAEIDLDRLEAHPLAARGGHLRQQRFVRADDDGAEQRDGLEDDQQIDGCHRVSRVGRRREEQHEEDRPQRRAEHDVRDPAAEAGTRAVAEVPHDRIIERGDDAGDGEQHADREGRKKRRQVRIARRRVVVQEPQAAALAERLAADPARPVESLRPERNRQRRSLDPSVARRLLRLRRRGRSRPRSRRRGRPASRTWRERHGADARAWAEARRRACPPGERPPPPVRARG